MTHILRENHKVPRGPRRDVPYFRPQQVVALLEHCKAVITHNEIIESIANALVYFIA